MATVTLAAVGVVAFGESVKADELADLQLQLQSLQSQLEQLQAAAPHTSVTPKDSGLISFYRGSENELAPWTERVGDALPADRGFTVFVTPTADMPAPVHQVTVSGYVKGDFIYDFNQDLGDYFGYSNLTERKSSKHVRFHARQSRFRIQSRSDTSVGQVRTLIEGDFFSGGAFGSTDFRMRHAWGEWDMLPKWSFGAGQTWRNFMSLITGITTVDFFGPAGLLGTSRVGQVRLTYRDGPNVFAISVEDPTGYDEYGTNARGLNDEMPDLVARWQYETAAGHQFLLSGAGRRFATEKRLGATDSDGAFGWVVQGAATINLSDFGTLSAGAIYGDGVGNYLVGNSPAYWINPLSGDINSIAALGIFAGVTFEVSEKTSINFGWGLSLPNKSDVKDAVADGGYLTGRFNKEVMSLHGNLIWKPVSELQLGWEVIYGQRDFYDMSLAGRLRSGDNIRGQFGAWFFF
ncbi:hypothetical protein FHS85_003139 [Rhodoligotrophos appendicifer]|uniref:porin n=1 Tax=Rhodoligotrophos appendicifer TaxID=987056 RepID=UPI00147937A7|nr:porin [Rhodoligotrophos appendicifer]